MYILNNDGSRFHLIESGNLKSAKDYYQRVTLNFDGVLTSYFYPRDSALDQGVDWSNSYSVPDNICNTRPSVEGDIDSGICGYNSICIDGANQKHVCQCPPSYSLMDPTDANGSCEPDFEPDICENGQDVARGVYRLVAVQNTDWPTADYAKRESVSEEQCKGWCQNDCFCAAAIFDDGSGSCWKKKLPLSLGRQGNWVSRTAWLKIGNGSRTEEAFDPSIFTRKGVYKWKAESKVLLGSSVSFNFILISVIGVGIFFVYMRKQTGGYDVQQRGSVSEYNSVHSFTYKELEYATDGFTEEIGRGAFGVVYKGKITAGGNPTFVAVKRLDRTYGGADKEFTTEVSVIGLTHHKNLVGFIGYCKEGEQRLLVYVYMSNGTIADILFCDDLRPSWRARIQLAQGIARGLLYLHEECSSQIIHCDIKPQNILVDDNQNARISDFGLAKLLVLNQSHTNTVVRGTKGYVSPEWFRNKPISVKADVYSFGVVLLEIICCPRNVCTELIPDETAILTDWAFDCFRFQTLHSLVGSNEEALNAKSPYNLETLVMIALWCIQDDPNVRPTMKKVTQMLEGVAEVPVPPCQDSFSVTL